MHAISQSILTDVTHFAYPIIFELVIARHEAIYFNFLSQATTLKA